MVNSINVLTGGEALETKLIVWHPFLKNSSLGWLSARSVRNYEDNQCGVNESSLGDTLKINILLSLLKADC